MPLMISEPVATQNISSGVERDIVFLLLWQFVLPPGTTGAGYRSLRLNY